MKKREKRKTEVVEVVEIGVLSTAKHMAITFAIIAFIAGLIYAIIKTTTATAAEPAGLFGIGGFLAVLILPIGYAIIGFVVGTVGAFLYNIISKWIGGVKIELKR
jgi:hypothetical protein